MKRSEVLVLFFFFLLFIMYSWPVTGTPITISVAVGRSMLPNIGEMAVVVGVKTNEVKVGDIVLYHSEELGNVVHRVVEVLDNGTIITKGDNNVYVDPPITPDEVKYKVVFVINPPASILVILLINAFLVAVPVYYVWAYLYPVIKNVIESRVMTGYKH